MDRMTLHSTPIELPRAHAPPTPPASCMLVCVQAKGGYTAANYGFDAQQEEEEPESESEEEVRNGLACGSDGSGWRIRLRAAQGHVGTGTGTGSCDAAHS
jgi:hypothetical protein